MYNLYCTTKGEREGFDYKIKTSCQNLFIMALNYFRKVAKEPVKTFSDVE